MVKREKRLRKSVENIKKQIEKHFLKLENDIENDDRYLADYHFKEMDQSLIDSLEYKMGLLKDYDSDIIEGYKKRLEKLKELFSEKN